MLSKPPRFRFLPEQPARLISTCSLAILLVTRTPLAVAVDPTSTLLLFNANDASGVEIQQYYTQARPGVRSLGLDLPDTPEEVSAEFYLEHIRQPLIDFLGEEGIADQIDTIVTTRGMPLRIDTGPQPAGSPSNKWQRYSSLESELARASTIDTVELMGNQLWELAQVNIPNVVPANPYYLGTEYDFQANPIPYGGPQAFDRSDPANEGIRLVTRLDGFSVEDVYAVIDRSRSPYYVPFGNPIIVDDDPNAPAFMATSMDRLALEVLPDNRQLGIYDVSNSAITGAPEPVLGYVSHGVNDLVGGLEPGYVANQLAFELADGAVFHTYESFNGRSFSNENEQDQALVGEWIEAGGTAGLAVVAEPGANQSSVANEYIFFDMMLNGHTFAEAAWASTRQLSYVNTAIGDPLMRWRPWVPGDTDLNGTVEFQDFFKLQQNWQKDGGYREGDLNGDGFVDEADFEVFQDNWLQSAGSEAFAAATLPVVEVIPVLNEASDELELSGMLLSEANLNGDLAVDDADSQIWADALGTTPDGDTDGDADTDLFDLLNWQREYAPYTLTADFNLDTVSDHDDFLIWSGSVGSNRGGDADQDGDTDLHDLLSLQRELSGSPPLVQAASATTAVPEPRTSLYLLLLLACAMASTGLMASHVRLFC